MKPKPATDHEIHELVKKRWSPRAFDPRPLPEETVLSLFEAARWAASCFNEQPWRFICASKDDSERYGQLLECLSEGNKVWADSAPLLILAMVKTRFAHNDKPNRWARHDLGLAVGNLTTQASSLDLYVHNMAGFSADQARSTFALADDLEPVTMIAVGHLGDPASLPDKQKKSEHAPQQRKPLSDLILTED